MTKNYRDSLDCVISAKKHLDNSRQYPIGVFTEGFDLADLYSLEDAALAQHRLQIQLEDYKLSIN